MTSLKVIGPDGKELWSGEGHYQIVKFAKPKTIGEWWEKALNENVDPFSTFEYGYEVGDAIVLNTPQAVVPLKYDPQTTVAEYYYNYQYDPAAKQKIVAPNNPVNPPSKEKMAELLEKAADVLLVDGWCQGALHKPKPGVLGHVPTIAILDEEYLFTDMNYLEEEEDDE